MSEANVKSKANECKGLNCQASPIYSVVLYVHLENPRVTQAPWILVKNGAARVHRMGSGR